MDIRDLCLLHTKDPPGTPSRPAHEFVNGSEPLTWTDLQRVLRGGFDASVIAHWISTGRLSAEKYAFYREAQELLRRRSSEGPRGPFISACQSVFDAVWSLESVSELHSDYLFRGQFNAEWPLWPSLLRPPIGASVLDVGTLAERLALTQGFLDELRNNQVTLTGLNQDENALLGVAQHFGFPTPLLDFTRSLRIAAFFATQAAVSWDGESPVCGVIYYVRAPERALTRLPGEALDVPIARYAGIEIGTLEVIEAHLSNEDDRIGRQMGVFVRDFRTKDLSEVLVDRVLFWQHPGVVFEDPVAGVTSEHLLPDRTPLSDLANKVNFETPERVILPDVLRRVKLNQATLIGSQGAMLSAQLREGASFLEEVNEWCDSDSERERLRAILCMYFEDVQRATLVSQAPHDGSSDLVDREIFRAIQVLAEWAGVSPRKLWNRVQPVLPSDASSLALDAPEGMDTRERVALSLSLYLASWEQLRSVPGRKARDLIFQAQLVFDG